MPYWIIYNDTIEDDILQIEDKKKTVASDIVCTDSETKVFNKVTI